MGRGAYKGRGAYYGENGRFLSAQRPAFILLTATNYFISEENIQALTVSMHKAVDKDIDFAQKKITSICAVIAAPFRFQDWIIFGSYISHYYIIRLISQTSAFLPKRNAIQWLGQRKQIKPVIVL